MSDWELDDRTVHPYTRLYMAGMWMRRDKAAFEGAANTLRAARQGQARGDAPPTRWTRRVRRVVEREYDGMRAWTVRPRRLRTAPAARVVYFHGGGYVHPLTKDYWRLVRALTGAGPSPVEVILPAYPLAPDSTVDEVLPKLVRMVRSLLDEDGAPPTVLMGDSAGGALVLAVATQLRDRSPVTGDGPASRPARLVLLSPWLDATLDERQVADLESSDPMLAESGLRAAGEWWAGERPPSDPLVSPVNAELHDLPPTDVFIGEHDILRPAVDDLVAHAERDRLELHGHEVAAMFHVWMTRAIPEGARTRRQLRGLLDREASRRAPR